jgi:hypothetical protein
MWLVRCCLRRRSLDTRQAATTSPSTSRQADSVLINPIARRRRLSLLCQTVHPRKRLIFPTDAPAHATALSAAPPSQNALIKTRAAWSCPSSETKTCHKSARRFPDTSPRPSAARCLGKRAALPYISIAPRAFATQLGFSHPLHMAAFPPSAPANLFPAVASLASPELLVTSHKSRSSPNCILRSSFAAAQNNSIYQ